MEGILIKVKNGWVLTVNDIIYATTDNAPYARLSAKNCQEIEQQKESNDDNHKDWWASKLDEEEDSEIYKPCLDENGCIILKLKSE
jgi:hypothetical protein